MGETHKKGGKILVYLQCYFVTIATILGTGILGLPVTLSESGLYPFLVSFLFGAMMQMLTVYFFTELLQLAHALQTHTEKEELVPLNDLLADETCDELEEEDETSESVLAGHVILPKHGNAQPPNLHLLGELFLSCGLLQAFDIILVLQFVALLISYSLAGSEAYAQVLGINYVYVIPVFVWVLTFLIVFALQLVQPLVSILTFFKGSLLLGTVAVTFYVGSEIHREIHNDFLAFGEPFLMGTVALGGVVNTMPLMYSKISPVKNQIQNFRLSVNLGLLTCTILNILWCWAVLDIVPQLSTFQCSPDTHSSESQGILCHNNISLQRSASQGEISTIPLTEIIKQRYPSFSWVAFLIELFIMVSITVSFLTVGAVLHHTLLGWLQSAWKKDKMTEYRTQSKVRCINSKCFCSSVVSLVVFSIVFGVSMLDPQGFVDILEKFSSFTINIEVALFIFLMCFNARRKEHLSQQISYRFHPCLESCLYLIPLYFGFA
uniref:Uncharacterized protein LOC111136680 n=1 Tax=Crassostrea virginica TaxID=6565 RepID=A0A8B8ETY6_CRAVI|nr:uncharacterized protein LOC111136680 [Crassostrea virginica]